MFSSQAREKDWSLNVIIIIIIIIIIITIIIIMIIQKLCKAPALWLKELNPNEFFKRSFCLESAGSFMTTDVDYYQVKQIKLI